MIFAKGTTFSWNSQTVALVKNIGLPEFSVDSVDITTHTSTSRLREFAAGLIDGGEVTIAGIFDETDTTGQQAMYTDAQAGTSRSCVITGPNSAFTLSFTGMITKIKPIGDAPIDNFASFNATIKLSGAPVMSITASNGLTTPFFAISNSAVVTPAASGSVYDYVATVLTGVTSVTVTPTATAGVITVNGNVVATGVASSAIALGAAGSITTVTIVVAETGKAAKTYTIRIARAAS